jgi:RHS repeat-associated protein
MTQTALPHAPTAGAAYTNYTYDGIGRTVSVLAPDGASTTTYSYQGNVVTVTDPAGKSKTFTMDAFGNLTQVSEPNPAGGANYITSYTYDLLNNLTQVSMPRPSGTQTRTFTYNGKLLTSATNPENGTVSYSYNANNKIATKTDAKGQAVAYTYDGLNRLTQVQRYPTGFSGSEDTCQRETYTYDNNTVTANYSQYVAGRLATVQYFAPPTGVPSQGTSCGATITEQYSYNQAGAKTNKGLLLQRTLQYQYQSNPIQSSSSTVDLESSYTYDNEGRMTSVQYPGSQGPQTGTQTALTSAAGPDYGYAYDTMGRLNTMTDLVATSTIISGTTYDAANRLLSIAGQYAESRTYNVLGQLTNVINGSVNFTYSYSATQNNGKITGQTDNVSGEQVVYAYDSLNRLATAGATNSSWGQSYAYDGFGNLTNQTVTAGTAPSLSVAYNAATNRQTGDCADANGNITITNVSGSCGANNPMYTYDVSNRIVSAPGGTQYAYAPGNKRIWKGITAYNPNTNAYNLTTDVLTFWSVTGQKLGDYTITGDPSVIYQWNGAGNTKPAVTAALAVANLYFGGKQIAKWPTGQYSPIYTGSDRLGSFGKYYPWGQEKPSATANGTEKFTSKERDAETGLDYFGARYFSSAQGRFTSPDWSAAPEAVPYADLSNPQSLNLYSYMRNNPLGGVDPDGHCCFSEVLKYVSDASVGFAKGTANHILDNVSNLAKNGNPVQRAVDGAIATDFRFKANSPAEALGMMEGEKHGETAISVVIAIGGMKGGKGEALEAETMGAAQRVGMREEGIPTSQQPTTQQSTPAGRQYTYEVPTPGGGTTTKIVQRNNGTDSSHPGEPHVEVGSPKAAGQTDSIGRPRLDSNKVKVDVKPNGQ